MDSYICYKGFGQAKTYVHVLEELPSAIDDGDG